MKDKNPLIKKKGANGIYFCFFLIFHKHASAHEITMAIDSPSVPNHMPPAPNNLISPIPIGGYFSCFFILSNINPTIKPKQYPIEPPITESAIVIGHGKNVVVNKPANKNGNKYTSGIIRRLKSALAIRKAQKIAPINTNEKNI